MYKIPEESTMTRPRMGNIPFQDSIKSNLFRRLMKKEVAAEDTSNEPAAAEVKNEIIFMKQNASLINVRDKNQEYEAFLREQRYLNSQAHAVHKFQNVKAKIYENRNPNVQNFLKDTTGPANPYTKSLEDTMKSEFNLFIDQSVNRSSDAVRFISAKGGVDHDNNNNDDEPAVDNVFITQEADKEIAEIMEKDRVATAAVSQLDSVKLPKLVSETPKDKSSPSKSKLQLTESNLDELQVALMDTDNTNNDKEDSSLTRLKKLIETIKKVDLPSFQSEFHQMCQYASEPELLRFYQRNIARELNSKQNGLGRYCVHECCVKGNVRMLKALLPYIDDVNKLDQNGQNPAHICAKYGEFKCLKLLAANGINLEQNDVCGLQPFHVAAKHNSCAIIEFLFEMGVPINVRCNSGKLAFHYSAEFGSIESLRKLCEYHVDLTVPDSEGNTVAHLAGTYDHLECLKYLVKLNFPVDKVRNNFGRNVAHMCCLHGSVKTLHWLFEFVNIDAMSMDDFGNSLAHSACFGGAAECLNCCIQHDVPFYSVNFNNETPIEMARKRGKSLHVEKAIRNQLRCEQCVQMAKEWKYEKEHEKTIGEKTVEQNRSRMYDVQSIKDNLNNTFNNLNFKPVRLHVVHEKKPELPVKLDHDLVAQYFGPNVS